MTMLDLFVEGTETFLFITVFSKTDGFNSTNNSGP